MQPYNVRMLLYGIKQFGIFPRTFVISVETPLVIISKILRQETQCIKYVIRLVMLKCTSCTYFGGHSFAMVVYSKFFDILLYICINFSLA